MKPHQLATLVLRLLGIYILIQAVPVLGMFSTLTVLAHMNSQEVGPAFVQGVLPGTLMLLIGFLLLAFASRLGRKLALPPVGEESFGAISFEQVQALVFAAVGLLIFADALPQILNSVTYLGSLVNFSNSESVGDRRTQVVVGAHQFREGSVAAGTVLKFALGIALFFGPRRLAKFWHSMRTFATPKPPQQEQ